MALANKLHTRSKFFLQKNEHRQSMGLEILKLRRVLSLRLQGPNIKWYAMIGNELYHTTGIKGGGTCGAISSFASWGVIARFLPLQPASKSVRVASRSDVRVASRSQGTNFENKISNFRCFFGHSDRNELYHTPLLSKIWGLGDRIFFVVRSL